MAVCVICLLFHLIRFIVVRRFTRNKGINRRLCVRHCASSTQPNDESVRVQENKKIHELIKRKNKIENDVLKLPGLVEVYKDEIHQKYMSESLIVKNDLKKLFGSLT